MFISPCLLGLLAPRGVPRMWRHRTGQVTAGQRRPGRRGNKSVIFHPVHKQVMILRWAIAYYGLRPACDISKQRRTALCKCLAWTSGECVLTSWHRLKGVWTSSPHGNPGRRCTCYDWAWEQTQVECISSCQLRHKLWIMNITEVMGLWDSFIALTNRISQEDRGGGMRQMTYFALQTRLLNFLTRLHDFWVTFILHSWAHTLVLNEDLSLEEVTHCVACWQDTTGVGGIGGKVCVLTQLSPKSQDSVHKPGGWISREGRLIGIDVESSEFCTSTDHRNGACIQMLPFISLINSYLKQACLSRHLISAHTAPCGEMGVLHVHQPLIQEFCCSWENP